MLRVAQHAERTDTGRRRGNNEDVYVARSPLFVVADGMGGAQAGEVASSTAVESLRGGIPAARAAPSSGCSTRSRRPTSGSTSSRSSNESYAGMGTTLTAAYVGENDVTIVHVGDSRCYRLRDGGLERLTVDHTLVEELVRQGRLDSGRGGRSPAAIDRDARARARGRRPLDATTYPARDGDVFLLCSDGLTDMVGEEQMLTVLTASPTCAPRRAGWSTWPTRRAAATTSRSSCSAWRTSRAAWGTRRPRRSPRTRCGAPCAGGRAAGRRPP